MADRIAFQEQQILETWPCGIEGKALLLEICSHVSGLT